MPHRALRKRLFRAFAATIVLTLVFFFASLDRGHVRHERQEQCAKQLVALGNALLLYQNDNRNRLPDTWAMLLRGQHLAPSAFVSPSDASALAAKDGAQFDPSDPTCCSFVYLGDTRGRWMSSPSAEDVVAFDRPSVHGNDGVHVLFHDGHVEFFPFLGRRPAWWATFEASIARGDRPLLLPGAAYQLPPR